MAYQTRIRGGVEFFVQYCPCTNRVQEIFIKRKDALRLASDNFHINYCSHCGGFHSHPSIGFSELNRNVAAEA